MRTIRIFAIATVFLMLVSVYLSLYTSNRIDDMTENVLENAEVVKQGRKAYGALLEAESNVRAYLLTFDEFFFEEYLEARNSIFISIDSLKQITRENTRQQLNIDLFRHKIEDRLEAFDSAAAYGKTHRTMEGYITSNKVSNAKTNIKLLKAYLDQIESYAGKEYRRDNLMLLSNLKALPFIVIIIAIVGLVTAALTFLSIGQYNRARSIADKKEQVYKRQLEEQVKQLNFSNNELEQFAYVASHDLQEPLRKITSFIDLLKANNEVRLDDEGKLYLDRIAFSSKRMRNLINDLLSFSRAGRRMDAAVEVDLNKVANAVLADLDLTIRESNAKIEIQTLPVVKGSETEFAQVFQNLLTNAIKFVEKDKTPVITVNVHNPSEVDIAAVPEFIKNHEYRTITLSDNGIGFDPAYADKIFNLFQRLHGRTEYTGTGIGLAICRRILEKYNGGIYATSTPGNGSTFHIVLPIVQTPSGG